MSQKLIPATHEEIAALAFTYFEAEGRPNGRHEIHWQRAYEELSQGTTTAAPVTLLNAEPVTKPAATDVSLIDGVGPVLTKKLKEVGIASLADIAGLTEAEMAKIDADLNLKGRSLREDWIAQAKDLVAGGTPRAKVDQMKAAKA